MEKEEKEGFKEAEEEAKVKEIKTRKQLNNLLCWFLFCGFTVGCCTILLINFWIIAVFNPSLFAGDPLNLAVFPMLSVFIVWCLVMAKKNVFPKVGE